MPERGCDGLEIRDEEVVVVALLGIVRGIAMAALRSIAITP